VFGSSDWLDSDMASPITGHRGVADNVLLSAPLKSDGLGIRAHVPRTREYDQSWLDYIKAFDIGTQKATALQDPSQAAAARETPTSSSSFLMNI